MGHFQQLLSVKFPEGRYWGFPIAVIDSRALQTWSPDPVRFGVPAAAKNGVYTMNICDLCVEI